MVGYGGPAVVLLSGGLDSSVAAALAVANGSTVYGLTVNYGQRHNVEVEKATQFGLWLEMKQHKHVDTDLYSVGSSALVGSQDVPKNRPIDSMRKSIPPTYVPARNVIFLSLAAAYAEAVRASSIIVGFARSVYPDCQPEFLTAFTEALQQGTRCGVEGRPLKIYAPFINDEKAQIIKTGLMLGVPFEYTHSCYDPLPNGMACGKCDSCLLRLKGFEEAGSVDPIQYAN